MILEQYALQPHHMEGTLRCPMPSGMAAGSGGLRGAGGAQINLLLLSADFFSGST